MKCRCTTYPVLHIGFGIVYGKERYYVVICTQFPRRQQAQQLVHKGYPYLVARVLKKLHVSATFLVSNAPLFT